MNQHSHTSREAVVLNQALGGLALLRKHERDAQFCFGVAWGTLNMIVRELGGESQESPITSRMRRFLVAEKFNKVEPLVLSDGDTMAEIETQADISAKYVGMLWLNTGWYSVESARELRDWLNKAIP